MVEESFSPDLFVGRERELERLIASLTAPTVLWRLQTIEAPPGYGKSWLLRSLKRRLSDRANLFVIAANASKLGSREKIIAWLRPVIEQAQAICPQVGYGDQDNTPEGLISQLLKNLCHQ